MFINRTPRRGVVDRRGVRCLVSVHRPITTLGFYNPLSVVHAGRKREKKKTKRITIANDASFLEDVNAISVRRVWKLIDAEISAVFYR